MTPARVAVFGGVYANPTALAAVLADARDRDCARIFNLGDLGGFGADINGVWPLLERYEVESIAGNYDIALGFDQQSCGCGYTDPDDQREAQQIYDLTHAAVDPSFAKWMQTLPGQLRLALGGQDVLMVHGSPIEVNDFLWESRSDDEIRRRLDAVPGKRPAVMLCSHTGIPWQRQVDATLVVNVGAVGKPPNNGSPDVAYAVLDLDSESVSAEIVMVAYDYRAQAADMRAAGLPGECAETIETGWWRSATGILPAAEQVTGNPSGAA